MPLRTRPAPALATGIVGDWLVAGHGAIIRIQQAGDQFDGYITWQLYDTYPPEDGPALDGKVVTDRNNSDPARRGRPLTGLRLLTGLRYDPADGKWIDGRVYDTENGRAYRCMAWLDGPTSWYSVVTSAFRYWAGTRTGVAWSCGHRVRRGFPMNSRIRGVDAPPASTARASVVAAAARARG